MPSIWDRLNPIQAARDALDPERLIGEYGPLFVNRQNPGQPSIFQDATRNIIVNLAGAIGTSFHPLAGLAARGIASAIYGGIASGMGNDGVVGFNGRGGTAIGIGTMLQHLPQLVGEFRNKRQDDFYKEFSRYFKRFSDFSSTYRQGQQELISQIKGTNERLDTIFGTKRKNPLAIERQKVDKEVKTQQEQEDPLGTYNNYQIENVANFSINPNPGIAPRRGRYYANGGVDRYGHKAIANNFFALA